MQAAFSRTKGKAERRPRTRKTTTLGALVHSERQTFARKVRGARAVLGWSQTELARRSGLTQTSIHRIEQGTSDLKHSTVVTLEKLFMTEGITFEDAGEFGFKIVVKAE